MWRGAWSGAGGACMLLSASLRPAITVGGAHWANHKIKQVSLRAHFCKAKMNRLTSLHHFSRYQRLKDCSLENIEGTLLKTKMERFTSLHCCIRTTVIVYCIRHTYNTYIHIQNWRLQHSSQILQYSGSIGGLAGIMRNMQRRGNWPLLEYIYNM